VGSAAACGKSIVAGFRADLFHDPRRILAEDQRKALIAPGSANPFGPSTRVNSPVSGSQVTRRGTKRPERASRKSVR